MGGSCAGRRSQDWNLTLRQVRRPKEVCTLGSRRKPFHMSVQTARQMKLASSAPNLHTSELLESRQPSHGLLGSPAGCRGLVRLWCLWVRVGKRENVPDLRPNTTRAAGSRASGRSVRDFLQ